MAKPTFDVIVCGSLHLDIVVDAPHLPRLDETAVGTSWRQVCGGKGGNQAVQAAKHGAKTAMIGRLGADDFGWRLYAHLDGAGVDRSGVRVARDARTGMSVAIIDANGDYGAVIVSGANLSQKATRIVAAWQRLGRARVLVLQNEIPEAANIAAADVARKSGALIILNAAPARSSAAALLDHVDVLLVNRIEAEMLASAPVVDRASAIAALPALGAAHRAVIVTLGGGGLVVAARGQPPVEIDALPVTVVSTHGAGDCFAGALAARLAAGDDIVAASRFANAAAGRFVSTPRAAS